MKVRNWRGEGPQQDTMPESLSCKMMIFSRGTNLFDLQITCKCGRSPGPNWRMAALLTWNYIICSPRNIYSLILWSCHSNSWIYRWALNPCNLCNISSFHLSYDPSSFEPLWMGLIDWASRYSFKHMPWWFSKFLSCMYHHPLLPLVSLSTFHSLTLLQFKF